MALERVGQVLCRKIGKGLGDYKEPLLELARATERPVPADVERLFETVREARNMAVHEGAWARHLGSRLVDFFLVLEQAIFGKMKYAEDIMVRQPVVAQSWHLIAHIRHTLLANSFSGLPVLWEDNWHIVTDAMIMRYLRLSSSKTEYNSRLSSPLETAFQEGEIVPVKAQCFPKETKIVDLYEKLDNMVLITEDSPGGPHLIGILNCFDLL